MQNYGAYNAANLDGGSSSEPGCFFAESAVVPRTQHRIKWELPATSWGQSRIASWEFRTD